MKEGIRIQEISCRGRPCVCPMKRYFEEGKLDIKWIDGYCKGNYHRCIRREMEEEGKYHSDNMLPDGAINN